MIAFTGPYPSNSKAFAQWLAENKKVNRKNSGEFTGRVQKGSYRILTASNGRRYAMPTNDYARLADFSRRLSTGGSVSSDANFSRLFSQIEQDEKDELEKENISTGYSISGLKRNVSNSADLIDYAFNSKTQIKNIVRQEGIGHIAYLEYNAKYLLLKVGFTKRGDEVVFFELPANVASNLIYLAQNKATAGTYREGGETKVRHQLGVLFWDLVRVRGTQNGTRYSFAYTEDNRTTMTSPKYVYNPKDITKGNSKPYHRVSNTTLKENLDYLSKEEYKKEVDNYMQGRGFEYLKKHLQKRVNTSLDIAEIERAYDLGNYTKVVNLLDNLRKNKNIDIQFY